MRQKLTLLVGLTAIALALVPTALGGHGRKPSAPPASPAVVTSTVRAAGFTGFADGN